MTRRSPLLAALLAAAMPACHKRELAIYDGPAVPLGKSFRVPAGRHYWSFAAKPGQRLRFAAAWPDGALDIEAGSAHRDGADLDDDEDEDVERASIQTAGPHRWTASWQVGPKANVAFISVGLSGAGVDPIELTIDREDH